MNFQKILFVFTLVLLTTTTTHSNEFIECTHPQKCLPLIDSKREIITSHTYNEIDESKFQSPMDFPFVFDLNQDGHLDYIFLLGEKNSSSQKAQNPFINFKISVLIYNKSKDLFEVRETANIPFITDSIDRGPKYLFKKYSITLNSKKNALAITFKETPAPNSELTPTTQEPTERTFFFRFDKVKKNFFLSEEFYIDKNPEVSGIKCSYIYYKTDFIKKTITSNYNQTKKSCEITKGFIDLKKPILKMEDIFNLHEFMIVNWNS